MRAEQRGYQLAQLRKNTGLVGIPRPAALLVSFDTPGARAQALVHAPAALRRRGVFVADYEIDAA